jgi:hypothetical protein
MDPTFGVWNILVLMHAKPHLFKILTNFTLVQINELVVQIVLTIWARA